MYAAKISMRVKILKYDVLFKTVRKISSNGHNHELLKTTFRQYRDVELQPLRVECSKRFGQSFTGAKVHTFPYCIDKNRDVVDPYQIDFNQIKGQDEKISSFYLDFKPLFDDGILKVNRHISQVGQEPEHTHENDSPSSHTYILKAVETLDKFLQRIEFHQQCLSDMAENMDTFYTEMETTILLANHLFSPLVSFDSEDKNCIITKESKSDIRACPCAEKCDAKNLYSNYEFGSTYLWFGRSDIMLYPIGGGAVNVIIRKNRQSGHGSNFENQTCRQIIEMKNNSHHLRMDKNIDQVVAQAITFAFYQRKYQKERNENPPFSTLIPTIIMSSHYFDIYLYDAENDVLLRNLDGPLPLFERSEKMFSKFNLSSILQLWMLINHSLLQPRLTINQLGKLRETCGIRKQLEESNLMKKVEDTMMIKSKFIPPRMKKPYMWNKI